MEKENQYWEKILEKEPLWRIKTMRAYKKAITKALYRLKKKSTPLNNL